MKTVIGVWIAQDCNGEINAFTQEPTLVNNPFMVGNKEFWTSEGNIIPLMSIVPGLNRIIQQQEGKDLTKEPVKGTITIEL